LSEDFPGLAGFRAGSLVAGYRLEAQVGAGGMAVVFRARDERLGRLVALKILAPALAADEGFRRRFIAESRAAAVVDDPHIIPVFEAGESGGVLFIAMRFVAGGDLRGVLAREGPLPPGRAAGFISPVASALDAAHRAGLVHRDVKPANVLVDAGANRPDHVYLSDFGVSKGAVSSVSLTGAGHFLGTPDYSAPEQIQSRAVDGRTDQYALACVAFQLLTGSVPFERDQGMAVLLAHLSEPPPRVSSRRPGLPAAADQVLAWAMAKVPEKRYGSCREFADALRDALGVAPYTPGIVAPGHPPAQTGASRHGFTAPATARRRPDPSGPGTEPASGKHAAHETAPRQQAAASARLTGATGRPRSFRLGAAAALAAVLAVAAGLSAFALYGGGTGTHSGSPSSATDSPSTRVSPRTEPAIAHRIATLAATLTGPGAGASQGSALRPSVAFSPYGITLASSYADGVYLWYLANRTISATLTGPGASTSQGASLSTSVAFSPDGRTLAVGDRNGSTYLWNLATNTITATLTDPGAGTSQEGVESVAFSPDGTTLAAGDIDGSTYLWSLATRTITATLTDPGVGTGQDDKGVVSVAFSPGGTTLAAGDIDDKTYLWSLDTNTITATLTDPGGNSVDSVAFSPNGTILAAGDYNASTYLWNLTTNTIIATLTDPGGSNDSEPNGNHAVWSVAFSPDGTTIAAGDGDGSTYLWNLATRTITATLTDPGAGTNNHGVFSVAFSPNGTTLAAGDGDGSTYLWNVPGRASS
jgi:serine/threonine protein kinase/WD40 repeat protein